MICIKKWFIQKKSSLDYITCLLYTLKEKDKIQFSLSYKHKVIVLSRIIFIHQIIGLSDRLAEFFICHKLLII